MESINNHLSPDAVLRIEGECTIYRAAELKQSVLAALEQSEASINIDLSAVSEIDTAGIQLLLLAKKTATLQKKAMHVVAHSQAVLEIVERWELLSYFGDSLVRPFGTDTECVRS